MDMTYNESAHKVDTAFDTLFRSLDVMEQRWDAEDDVTLIVDSTRDTVQWWKEYKKQLARHMEEHKS
jgi:hypothetical protein